MSESEGRSGTRIGGFVVGGMLALSLLTTEAAAEACDRWQARYRFVRAEVMLEHGPVIQEYLDAEIGPRPPGCGDPDITDADVRAAMTRVDRR